MIRACNLIKRFDGGITAVCGVGFELPAGGFLRLAGPSGSGKTTLLRLLAGLDEPDSGEVWLDGRLASRPGSCAPPHRRGIGMVFQRPALWPHMTVAQNVAFGLASQPQEKRAARVEHLLHALELSLLSPRRPRALSGGEAQRVALARALAPRLPILLLDEPFSNLDPALRSKAAALLREEAQAIGTTVVLVSHDEPPSLLSCTRVLQLEEGRVVHGVLAEGRP